MFKEIFKDYSKKERIAVSIIGSILMALAVVLLYKALTTQ
jgi:flagellar biosynthesis/type III secretory pathway M-ring protein FliF/YscJ